MQSARRQAAGPEPGEAAYLGSEVDLVGSGVDPGSDRPVGGVDGEIDDLAMGLRQVRLDLGEVSPAHGPGGAAEPLGPDAVPLAVHHGVPTHRHDGDQYGITERG